MQHVDHPAPAQPVDDDALARTPPHDIVAEQAVLSSCMFDPACWHRAAQIIDRHDFFRPSHQLIWDLMGQQLAHEPPLPIDPIALRAEIDKLGLLRQVDNGNYLFDISSTLAGDVEFNAGTIAEKARLRRAYEFGLHVRDLVLRGVDGETILRKITEFQQAEQQRAGGPRKTGVEAMLAELLDSSALDNLPALEPLVGDLLHKDTLARIIGPSGHMKSFVTIDVAAHVGTGRPWHGHPVSQGTVIYLVAEGARGIRKRVRAWERHHRTRMDNVLFLPRPVQALDPEWLTLIEACRRMQPALIVIDTQARVSVGVEENSAKELGLVIDRMEQLRAATAACVLLIHHTGHVGDHGRGSTSAKGALQSELHVSKKGDKAANTLVTVKTGKQKDDEETGDIQFGLKVVSLPGEAKADGSPVTSVVLVPAWEAAQQQTTEFPEGSIEWLVRQLDDAKVPVGWGNRLVRKWFADNGIAAGSSKVEAVVRVRKSRAEDVPRHVPYPPVTEMFPEPEEHQHISAGQTFPGNTGGTFTGHVPPKTFPLPPSREGEHEDVGNRDSPKSSTLCNACHEPLDPDWARRGYDTHLMCAHEPGDAA